MSIAPDEERPLALLVCGFEKSGTTLLMEILRRSPVLDAGHEIGVLLGQTPRQFPDIQPYFTFFHRNWGLTLAQARACCDTDDWMQFYRRLRQESPRIGDGDVALIDKTPKYMRGLSRCLSRVPGVPCIVNVRDPRAVMHSWACWSGHREDAAPWIDANLPMLCGRYLAYARGYAEAARTGAALYLNSFERMCRAPETVIPEIFAFIGVPFEADYLNFSSEHFVYGNTVSQAYLFPWRGVYSDDLSERILHGTAEFAAWQVAPDS